MDMTKEREIKKIKSDIAKEIFNDIENRFGCFRVLIGVSESAYTIFEELDKLKKKYINND
jgi:archaellum component FlaC